MSYTVQEEEYQEQRQVESRHASCVEQLLPWLQLSLALSGRSPCTRAVLINNTVDI
jgi:hypothetical protein